MYLNFSGILPTFGVVGPDDQLKPNASSDNGIAALQSAALVNPGSRIQAHAEQSAIASYKRRFGIEEMFRDFKTGG